MSIRSQITLEQARQVCTLFSYNYKLVFLLHIPAKREQTAQDDGRKIRIRIYIPSATQTPMHNLNYSITGFIFQTIVLTVVHNKSVGFSMRKFTKCSSLEKAALSRFET